MVIDLSPGVRAFRDSQEPFTESVPNELLLVASLGCDAYATNCMLQRPGSRLRIR